MNVTVDIKKPAAPLQGSYSAAALHNKRYHKCDCYGHTMALPNYKILGQPRTNNYYASTGGCPCIPRAVAHPGSWRLKAAQLRSTTYRHGAGCTKSRPPGATCCVHTGETYGWKEGPHSVLAKNTAATGLCDTFGNMSFKRKTGIRDNRSDVSSVCNQKLEDLEALILEEHDARRTVEADVLELGDIQRLGTQDLYKRAYENDRQRRLASMASEQQLGDLLREVRSIVKKPLNQTNIDILRGIVERQEVIMGLREAKAKEDFPEIVIE